MYIVPKDLWKKFGSGIKSKTAVKGLSFGVERGEIFGLLGPNGAGKTSSLNMITTDFPPTKGKVLLGIILHSGNFCELILVQTFEDFLQVSTYLIDC